MPLPGPLRVSDITAWCRRYNCTAQNYDGLPVCFSWPVLPSTISKESLLVTLTDGSQASSWGMQGRTLPT